uniref:Uncharacterized protein n=1 Tax=Caenorhabditis japonica TaxID=281687 RepID=A0A8R1HMP6_CAEJA
MDPRLFRMFVIITLELPVASPPPKPRLLSAFTYQRHGTQSSPPYTLLSATNKISLSSRVFMRFSVTCL